MSVNQPGDVNSLPIEYYTYSWASFSREGIIPKSIPIKSATVDSSISRYQNGSDIYVSRIIQEILSDEQRVEIAQAHRKLRDSFAQDQAIIDVNQMLQQQEISNKSIELSVELSTASAWETSLSTYLDNIPFSYVGKGEQALVKMKLALSHKKSKEANVLLLEEPENHLSHSKLNKLVNFIKSSHGEKQIIISTHSSFVANKLGLNSLILINVDEVSKSRNDFRFSELKESTQRYFEKLPGYDTLRLLLCRKAILVEGDSDELVVQKAYILKNKGRLPIEDEIDVISVKSLAFERFLEIAKLIAQPVAVVTDNDGDVESRKLVSSEL